MNNKKTEHKKMLCRSFAIAHVPVIQCEPETQTMEDSISARSCDEDSNLKAGQD